MAKRGEKTVLFLGADARLAEERFNAVAGRMGLPPPWRAVVGAATADRVVALTGAHRLPGVECWELGERPGAETLDREVMGLVARILGGGERAPGPPPPRTSRPRRRAHEAAHRPRRAGDGRPARQRGDDRPTTLPLDDAALAEPGHPPQAAVRDRRHVKDGRIEIQGDASDRVSAELEKLGYRVKRVGG